MEPKQTPVEPPRRPADGSLGAPRLPGTTDSFLRNQVNSTESSFQIFFFFFSPSKTKPKASFYAAGKPKRNSFSIISQVGPTARATQAVTCRLFPRVTQQHPAPSQPSRAQPGFTRTCPAMYGAKHQNQLPNSCAQSGSPPIYPEISTPPGSVPQFTQLRSRDSSI